MASLDGATTMGPVRLTVADLDRAQRFYRRVIGLAPLPDDGEVVRLGSAPDVPLVELVGRPDAPARPRGSTGLFHLALLVPSRPELARALERVARAGWSFTGASDHLVSEALYLNDPEGNGIEIYRDRPREEWRHENGELAMATLPLDLEGVMGELPRRRRRARACRPARAWATCTSRSATSPRRSASTTACWASTSWCAATPAPSSWRPAATTTTSASTRGPGRGRRRRRPGPGAWIRPR